MILIALLLCFASGVHASNFEDFKAGIGTQTQFGYSYYGFFINPYKTTQSLYGTLSYDIAGAKDQFGSLNYRGFVDLAYDKNYTNYNPWSTTQNVYWSKRWENFLRTELGWETNQRVAQQNLYTQEFYGKVKMDVDDIPFGPYISYRREMRQFGFGMTSFGAEQTLPLSKWCKVDVVDFGLLTKAELRYMNIDKGSSLNQPGTTFNDWHSYSFLVGAPISKKHSFGKVYFTPSVEFIGPMSSSACRNMKYNSFTGNDANQVVTRLDLATTF